MKNNITIIPQDKGPVFLFGNQDTNELFLYKKKFSFMGYSFYKKELLAGAGDMFELVENSSGRSYTCELINVNLLGVRLRNGRNEFFYNNGKLDLIGNYEN